MEKRLKGCDLPGPCRSRPFAGDTHIGDKRVEIIDVDFFQKLLGNIIDGNLPDIHILRNKLFIFF